MSEFSDVFKALKTAIQLEYESFNGYIRFSAEADDAEVESLFRQIADDEKAHKEILESELQALKETQLGQTKRPYIKPAKRRDLHRFQRYRTICYHVHRGV